eukprot:2193579-Pyramimonas_sp.AAC.1
MQLFSYLLLGSAKLTPERRGRRTGQQREHDHEEQEESQDRRRCSPLVHLCARASATPAKQ